MSSGFDPFPKPLVITAKDLAGSVYDPNIPVWMKALRVAADHAGPKDGLVRQDGFVTEQEAKEHIELYETYLRELGWVNPLYVANGQLDDNQAEIGAGLEFSYQWASQFLDTEKPKLEKELSSLKQQLKQLHNRHLKAKTSVFDDKNYWKLAEKIEVIESDIQYAQSVKNITKQTLAENQNN